MKIIKSLLRGAVFSEPNSLGSPISGRETQPDDLALLIEGPVKNGHSGNSNKMCRVAMLTGVRENAVGWLCYTDSELAGVRDMTLDELVLYSKAIQKHYPGQEPFAVKLYNRTTLYNKPPTCGRHEAEYNTEVSVTAPAYVIVFPPRAETYESTAVYKIMTLGGCAGVNPGCVGYSLLTTSELVTKRELKPEELRITVSKDYTVQPVKAGEAAKPLKVVTNQQSGKISTDNGRSDTYNGPVVASGIDCLLLEGPIAKNSSIHRHAGELYKIRLLAGPHKGTEGWYPFLPAEMRTARDYVPETPAEATPAVAPVDPLDLPPATQEYCWIIRQWRSSAKSEYVYSLFGADNAAAALLKDGWRISAEGHAAGVYCNTDSGSRRDKDNKQPGCCDTSASEIKIAIAHNSALIAYADGETLPRIFEQAHVVHTLSRREEVKVLLDSTGVKPLTRRQIPELKPVSSPAADPKDYCWFVKQRSGGLVGGYQYHLVEAVTGEQAFLKIGWKLKPTSDAGVYGQSSSEQAGIKDDGSDGQRTVDIPEPKYELFLVHSSAKAALSRGVLPAKIREYGALVGEATDRPSLRKVLEAIKEPPLRKDVTRLRKYDELQGPKPVEPSPSPPAVPAPTPAPALPASSTPEPPMVNKEFEIRDGYGLGSDPSAKAMCDHAVGYARRGERALVLQGPYPHLDGYGFTSAAKLYRIRMLSGEHNGKEGYFPCAPTEVDSFKEVHGASSAMKQSYVVEAPTRYQPGYITRFAVRGESPEEALEAAGLFRSRRTDRTDTNQHRDLFQIQVDGTGSSVTMLPTASHPWVVKKLPGNSRPHIPGIEPVKELEVVRIIHSRDDIGGPLATARAQEFMTEKLKAASTPALPAAPAPPAYQVKPTLDGTPYKLPPVELDIESPYWVARVNTNGGYVYIGLRAKNITEACWRIGLNEDGKLGQTVPRNVLLTSKSMFALTTTSPETIGWHFVRLSELEAAVITAEDLHPHFENRNNLTARHLDGSSSRLTSVYRLSALADPWPDDTNKVWTIPKPGAEASRGIHYKVPNLTLHNKDPQAEGGMWIVRTETEKTRNYPDESCNYIAVRAADAQTAMYKVGLRTHGKVVLCNPLSKYPHFTDNEPVWKNQVGWHAYPISEPEVVVLDPKNLQRLFEDRNRNQVSYEGSDRHPSLYGGMGCDRDTCNVQAPSSPMTERAFLIRIPQADSFNWVRAYGKDVYSAFKFLWDKQWSSRRATYSTCADGPTALPTRDEPWRVWELTSGEVTEHWHDTRKFGSQLERARNSIHQFTSVPTTARWIVRVGTGEDHSPARAYGMCDAPTVEEAFKRAIETGRFTGPDWPRHTNEDSISDRLATLEAIEATDQENRVNASPFMRDGWHSAVKNGIRVFSINEFPGLLPAPEAPKPINPQSNETKSEKVIMANNENTKSAEMLKTLKIDANDAAWRTAGSQLVKITKEPLVALLCRHLGPNDESLRGRIAAFLDTEIGSVLIESLLAAGLSAMPNTANGIPQKLGRELRIAAMADSADMVADLLMGPLMQVATTFLKGAPEDLDLPDVKPAATLPAPQEQFSTPITVNGAHVVKTQQNQD